MGCYPSRPEGVSTLNPAPTTPVTASCCAPVRGQMKSPSESCVPQAGWVADNEQLPTDHKSAVTTPGQEETPNNPPEDLVGVKAESAVQETESLPGALQDSAGGSPQPTCANSEPTSVEQKSSSPKYKAYVPVRGEYVPVSFAPADLNSIDFDAEKMKIEQQFCTLEKALDEGTMERPEIEKQFEMLTNQAARLRRLQAQQQAQREDGSAQQAAPSSPPVRLAPVGPAAIPRSTPTSLAPLAPAAGLMPTMAVVHWKGVTKKKFKEYKETILGIYGEGAEGIKSIERIPNRILITVPCAEVMMKLLSDTTLDDLNMRPEPYRLPGGTAAAPPKAATGLSKPGALHANASSLLAPPDGLAPLRSPSTLGNATLQPRAASPFTAASTQ
eukprot:TRINITY_DN1011_c0_g1_i16.p1 TRINITY_DN1011_c0_g1~~TRINITY_DN1011_c0_g1_i16.p1  ORF type:complete len:386 (-),score=73.27 TRINITY_DN1011_c0_g1_i16:424-1581(-)